MEREDAERGGTQDVQDIIGAQCIQIASQQRKLERLLGEDEEATTPTESEPSASSSDSSEERGPTGSAPRRVSAGRLAWRRLRVRIAKVSHERKLEAFNAGKALVEKDLAESERVGARLVHRVGGMRPAGKDPVRELGRSFKRGVNQAIKDYLKRSAEPREESSEVTGESGGVSGK